jgi:hypothetical protein
MMYAPPQAAPVPRGTRSLGDPHAASVWPQATPNTCACSGDQTYNQCSVTRNDCNAGYYPECKGGAYNCGCTCLPG